MLMKYEFNEDDFTEGEDHNDKVKNHSLVLHLNELTATLQVLLAYPKTEDKIINSHIEIKQESLFLIKAKRFSALRALIVI